MTAFRITATVTAIVALLALAGCQKAKPVLHVFNWADYLKPELVQRFERENNCSVVIDTFDSNESMYNKLKAGATGYDVIFPSSYFVDMMVKQKMLLPLDHAQLTNLVHLDPAYMRFATDPAMQYSVPYMMSSTGIAYRKDRVKDFTPSWRMFDRADLKGRTTLMNDYRETIGAALKFLGYSVNTTNTAELTKARAVVIRWKKLIAKFENEQYKNGIAAGEFLLVHGYNGDLLQVANENTNVVFELPAEGALVALDNMAILKTAQNVALAHKFINFIHDPKVAAENIEFVLFLCPNKDAYQYLSAATRTNPVIFPPAAVLDKCESQRDLGPATALYLKLWDEIKAAE
ncbi:MAG: spermidine/putrescine ABC transporter substrate-binding protein [bacterium]|nr:spermidine/putrescine ABC transporter substrate-binding protein [bacterium]